MNKFVNKIIHGDCLDIMKKFPDNSIDLTVTSPPYDNLREYKGYVFDFENIANELYRITKNGGVLVWVVGDATINGSETGTSFKQALYFKDVCGFNLHDTMIYKKTNPIPLTHNRYEQSFEYMFVLSKGKLKTFNPIKVATQTGYKIYKIYKGKVDEKRKAINTKNKIITSQKTRNKYNVWEYLIGSFVSTDSRAHDHPAIFPEQLALDHILSWSNPGDVVLDPMCGSGTTCKMAVRSGRKYIGVDISEEYCNIAKQRVGAEQKNKKYKLFNPYDI